ncbi:NUDIX domain-containing protein [Kitasatospora sp. NPDC048365]|uniref:NUDIX domain-containing protein n=1 Tax=Kitasatospora sp. NPDC048365 TaxID=3364050 RepID=UPI00371E4618
MDGRGLLAAAGVLIPDGQGRIMLVRVSYQAKHPIEIPGGGWEPPDASPRVTAVREIEEELGITPRLGPIACLDWSRDRFRPPIAAFLYWAEPLTPAELAGVRLEAEELSSYAFLTPEQVASALPPLLSRRVTACLRAPRAAGPLELEDGRPVGHSAEHLPADPPVPPYTAAEGVPLTGGDRPAPPPPMDRETYIASRPRIRAKARTLYTDRAGRVLLVRLRPLLRDEPPYWTVPGGSIEADRELPREAAARETLEELGWSHRPTGRLLALDWTAPGDGSRPVLVYLFDGGEVGPADLAAIRLPADELEEWRMFTPDEARTVLSPQGHRRLTAALATRGAPGGGPVELHDGFPA